MARKRSNQEILEALGPALKIKFENHKEFLRDYKRDVQEIETVSLSSSDDERDEIAHPNPLFKNPYFQHKPVFQPPLLRVKTQEELTQPPSTDQDRATSFLKNLSDQGLLELAKRNLEGL